MKKIDNLYFTKGLTVHVNQTADKKYYYPTAFVTPINPNKYPYKYAIKSSVINKIEDSGSYNRHYFKSVNEMIKIVKKISKQRLIKKGYYQ